MIKTKLLLALCTASLLTACGKEPSSSTIKQAIINQITATVIHYNRLDKSSVNLDLDDYTINEKYTSGIGDDMSYIYRYTAITKSDKYQDILNKKTVCGKVILSKLNNGGWDVGGRIGNC